MGFMVETNDLTRTFKGQKAVDRVSLHVPEGSVYGLLGPNGAGKSTLLKMLCGMLRPTSGEIAFAGRPWTRDDLNDIGALIESPPLYDNLTARENLRVRTTLLGVPENRIDEALATVGLPETGRKRAGQFSMGMKQRLGIALALVGHPRLLILDEPTNGLDPVGIQELRALVRSFPEHGITVVLSSHILNEVEHMADLAWPSRLASLPLELSIAAGMGAQAQVEALVAAYATVACACTAITAVVLAVTLAAANRFENPRRGGE